jgi:hypothetical protein
VSVDRHGIRRLPDRAKVEETKRVLLDSDPRKRQMDPSGSKPKLPRPPKCRLPIDEETRQKLLALRKRLV